MACICGHNYERHRDHQVDSDGPTDCGVDGCDCDGYIDEYGEEGSRRSGRRDPLGAATGAPGAVPKDGGVNHG